VGGSVTGNLLISVIAGTVTTLTLLALSAPQEVVAWRRGDDAPRT
jgi:hypothetical protein